MPFAQLFVEINVKMSFFKYFSFSNHNIYNLQQTLKIDFVNKWFQICEEQFGGCVFCVASGTFKS